MEYWITRLDNVRQVLLVLLLGCIYIAGNALMNYVKSSSRSDETNFDRIFRYAFAAVCVLVVLLVLVPSSSEALQLVKP